MFTQLIALAFVALGLMGTPEPNYPKPESSFDYRQVGICNAGTLPVLKFVDRQFDDKSTVMRSVQGPGIHLKFSKVIDVAGITAHCIESVRGNLVHFRRQGDYELTRDRYLKRYDAPKLPPSSPYAAQPEQTGPLLNGRRPSSVAALGFPPFGPERVGVWTDPGGSSIALFETGADVGTPPRVVGTTTARLRGISYFPAPDAPTGTITVIRDIAPDHVEIWVGELRTKPFVR